MAKPRAPKVDPRFLAESEFGGKRGMSVPKDRGEFAAGKRYFEKLWALYGTDPSSLTPTPDDVATKIQTTGYK